MAARAGVVAGDGHGADRVHVLTAAALPEYTSARGSVADGAALHWTGRRIPVRAGSVALERAAGGGAGGGGAAGSWETGRGAERTARRRAESRSSTMRSAMRRTSVVSHRWAVE